MRKASTIEMIRRVLGTGMLVLALFILALLAVACQPTVEVVEVEVTRQAVEQVEVTRVVTEQSPALPPVVQVVTETVTTIVEVTDPVAGSPDRPFLLVIPATVPEGLIRGRSQALLEALAAEVPASLELTVTATVEETAELLCAEPDRVLAFLPALAVTWAEESCGARPALVGTRFDVPWHAGMLVVRANDGIASLDDLSGRRLGLPADSSVARYDMALATLARAGIEPSDIKTFENDNSALLALLAGEVDASIASFNPPVLPFAERAWVYGEDDPELWRSLGVAANRHPIGYVDVLQGGPDAGGYRIRDARAALFDARRTVFDETRIVQITEPVPNGALVVGPDVPWANGTALVTTIQAFGNTEACAQSICSPDFFNWQGLEAVAMEAFDSVRTMIQTLDLDRASLFAADPEY